MPIRVKLLLVALVVGMVGIAIYTVNNSVTGPNSASESKPSYVDRLIPESGTKVLSQATVGVDLKEGYDAFLVVGGKAIRNNAHGAQTDGLQRTPSQGIIEYDPGPGKRVEKLATPRDCVDAWIWKISEGEKTAQQLRWCFETS